MIFRSIFLSMVALLLVGWGNAPAKAAEIVWTLHDVALQDQAYAAQAYGYYATVSGSFTIDSNTGALESYQFSTTTAVFDTRYFSTFFPGAPYPGPAPGASFDNYGACNGYCFYGPPQAYSRSTSVYAGYADDEPVAGYLPNYHTHELQLNFSGPLTTPGTIDVLGSSFERWDTYADGDLYKRYATSGFATSTVLGAVPEPSTWAMMIVGFAGLGFAGYKQAKRRVIVA